LTRIPELGTEPAYSVSIRGLSEILLDIRDSVREKLYRTEQCKTCVVEAGLYSGRYSKLCSNVPRGTIWASNTHSTLFCLQKPQGRRPSHCKRLVQSPLGSRMNLCLPTMPQALAFSVTGKCGRSLPFPTSMTCFGNSSPLRTVAAHVRVSHSPVLLLIHGHESTRQTIEQGHQSNYSHSPPSRDISRASVR
jgi:hypothetical protein